MGQVSEENISAVTPPVKAGYKTTEFWMSLVAVILGALYSSGVIVEGTAVDKWIGVAVIVLTTMGYQVSRSIAKK